MSRTITPATVVANVTAPSVSAAKWSTASTVGRNLLQFLAQVILARTLGPDAYGVFGLGMVVLAFASFLGTFGFGWTLQQIQDLRDEDIRFAFTWQLISGVAAGLVLYWLAPILSEYFRDPRLRPVIQWLALACVLTAGTSVATNLLMRELNFRAVGLIDLASYTIGYILVGIPLAMVGAGVNALVTAWLTQCGVTLVLSLAVRRHPLRPLWWHSRAGTMLSVVGTVFVTNFVNWSLNSVDRLFIGRLMNTHALGLYNVAYNLATGPNGVLLVALQPAFFSASARMQDDRRRLRRAYLGVVATIWVIFLPPFVFLSVVAPDIIRLLYGDKWEGAGPVLRLLFIAMPAYIMFGMSTPVLWNSGRKRYEALLQLPLLVIAPVAFYQLSPNGLHAAASVAVGLLVARALLVGTAAFHAVGLRFTDLSLHLLKGSVLSVMVAVGALVGRHVTAPWSSPMLTLMVATVLALLLAVGTVWMRPAVLGTHAANMIGRFVPYLRNLLAPSGL